MGGNRIVPDQGRTAGSTTAECRSSEHSLALKADKPSGAVLEPAETEVGTSTTVSGLASLLAQPDKASTESSSLPCSRILSGDESIQTLGSIKHCEDPSSFRLEELRRRDTSKPNPSGASRIFISHCWRKTSDDHQLRKRQLIATLSTPPEEGGAGVTYWSDYLDLQAEGPVAWRIEIEKGIMHSSKFVCLVDEGWLTSYACLQELAYAKAYNKPLAVVILDQEAWDILTNPHVNSEKAWEMKQWGPSLSSYVGQEIVNVKDPATGIDVVEYFSLGYVRKLFIELSNINFCPCRPLDEVNLGLAEVSNKLQKYVTKDLKYYAQHAELQSLALKWHHEGNKREPHMLHLDLASTWKIWINMATFAGMQPAPTSVQRQYVKESLRFAQRRRRWLQGLGIALLLLVMAGLVASIVLAVWAVRSRDQARKQADIARNQSMVALNQTIIAQLATAMAIEQAQLALNKSILAEIATQLAVEQAAIAHNQSLVAQNQTLYAQQQATIAALAARKSIMIMLLSIVGKYPANTPSQFITAEQVKGVAHALRIAANTSLVNDMSLRAIAMEAVARVMNADSRGKGVFECAGYCTAVAWSPLNPHSLLYGSNLDPLLRGWDPSSPGSNASIAFDYPPQSICYFVPCSNTINSLSWSPDGKYLATASTFGGIMVWDFFNGYKNSSPQPIVLRKSDGYFSMTLVAWSVANVLAIADRRIESQTVQLWRMFVPNAPCAIDPLGARGCQRQLKSRLQSTRTSNSSDWNTVFFSVAIDTDRINCMDWSRDGIRLAVGANNHTTLIINVVDSRRSSKRATTVSSTTLERSVGASLVAWSPARDLLACVTVKALVTIWSFEVQSSPVRAASFATTTPGAVISSMAWSLDGTVLAISDSSGKITFWNMVVVPSVPNGANAVMLHNTLLSLDMTQQLYFGMSWSTDGNLLALAGRDLNLRVIDLPWNKHRLWRILRTGQPGEVCMTAFSSEGNLMAYATIDGMVHIWNVVSPSTGCNLLASVKANGPIYSIAWSRDNTIAVGLEQAGVQVWGIPSFAELTRSGTSTTKITMLWAQDNVGTPQSVAPWGAVWSLQFSPDGSKLAATANNGELLPSTVRVWDLTASPIGMNWTDLGNLTAASSLAYGKLTHTLAWSSNGRYLAAGCEDGKIHIWRTNVWESKLLTINAFVEATSFLSWSPDSTRLAATTKGSDAIYVYRFASDGTTYTPLMLPGSRKALSIVWSPSGTRLIAACATTGIILTWDLNYTSSRPAVVVEIPWRELLPASPWLYLLAWNHKTNWVAFPYPTTTGTVKATSGVYMFDASWLDGSMDDWYHLLTYDYVGNVKLTQEDLMALSVDVPESFLGVPLPTLQEPVASMQGRSWQVEDLFNTIIEPDTIREISCPANTKMNIVYARYGTATITWLSKVTSGTSWTPHFQAQCNLAAACNVSAQVDFHQESAPWSDPKFLVVGWTCGQPNGVWLWFEEHAKHNITLSCKGAQDVLGVQYAQAFPSGDVAECAACPGSAFTSDVQGVCERGLASCNFDVDLFGISDDCPLCSKLWLFNVLCLGAPPMPRWPPPPFLPSPPQPPPPPTPPPPLYFKPDRSLNLHGVNVILVYQGRITTIACNNGTTISVKFARFGVTWGVGGANMTTAISSQCDGLAQCNVTSWYDPDPVPLNIKYLSMGWTCEVPGVVQTMVYKSGEDSLYGSNITLACPSALQLDVLSALAVPSGVAVACTACPGSPFTSSVSLECNGLSSCNFKLAPEDQCVGCYKLYIIQANCV